MFVLLQAYFCKSCVVKEIILLEIKVFTEEDRRFFVQAPVVQRLDNAIQRINHYPADSVVCFVNTYPLDSDLSGG